MELVKDVAINIQSSLLFIAVLNHIRGPIPLCSAMRSALEVLIIH